MRIFVLIVEHHNGHDVYPCASYKRALDRLDQYVLEWWGSTRGRIASEVAPATPGDPATMTQDERINDAFFDYWGDKRREFYEIKDWELLE